MDFTGTIQSMSGEVDLKMREFERLAELLSSIPSENFRECEDEYGLFAFGDIASEADELASELFITRDGQPNFGVIMEFNRTHDFKVRPGETDSFGWLTGTIWFPDDEHCLVFG